MSVYIKGMDMPKDHVRVLVLRDDGRCIDEFGNAFNAVPVPPHGRLIDADALKHSLCVECELYPNKCLEGDCDWDCIWHIDHAPTIIPAEEAD